MNLQEAKLVHAKPVARYLISERAAGRDHFLFADFFTAIDSLYQRTDYNRALAYLEKVREPVRLRNTRMGKHLESLIESVQRM